MNLFCKLGLHWRMKIDNCLFIDAICWRQVYAATCPCKRKWMVDSKHGFPFFKVEMNNG
jgi:hypothetical protein